MKKHFIIGTALICTLGMYDAFAAGVVCLASVCGERDYVEVDLTLHCATKTSTCWGDSKYYSCGRCESGYTRKEVSTGPITGCQNTGTFFTCEKDCEGCTNCTSDLTWSAYEDRFQRRTIRTCNCNTCVETYTYQCAPGYYGSSSDGVSGCEHCPSVLGRGEPWGTSYPGATDIAQCFVASNTEICGDTGCFKFTQDCYWQN